MLLLLSFFLSFRVYTLLSVVVNMLDIKVKTSAKLNSMNCLMALFFGCPWRKNENVAILTDHTTKLNWQTIIVDFILLTNLLLPNRLPLGLPGHLGSISSTKHNILMECVSFFGHFFFSFFIFAYIHFFRLIKFWMATKK